MQYRLASSPHEKRLTCAVTAICSTNRATSVQSISVDQIFQSARSVWTSGSSSRATPSKDINDAISDICRLSIHVKARGSRLTL